MRHGKKITLIKISLSFAFLLLTSCTLFKPVAPVSITSYVLNSIPHRLPKYHSRSVSLYVQTPTSNAVYNSNRMMYREKAHQIAAFALNEWAKTPNQMLEPLIVESLQKTNYFQSLITAPHMGNYSYSLSTHINQLLQDYSKKYPILRLTVQAQIKTVRSQRVIASKVFKVTVPIKEHTPYGGVKAANRATAIILKQLVHFTIKTIGSQ